MSYITEELKKDVKVHYITTNKFKTDLISVFLTVPLNRETVTKNAVIPAVLRRGTENLKTQEEISIELENMYGATFDCGIEKIGDNHVLKFYLESIDDNFLPQKENILKKSIDLLLEIILNPLLENGAFKEEYVKTEKENIKNIIQAKIDNKDKYAFDRCIEEMYKNREYGIYKYGYVEDLESINANNLYEQYKKLIQTSKIDVFISGEFEENKVKEIINNNENIKSLKAREETFIINNEEKSKIENKEVKTIIEQKDVTQGKLVIGMDVNCNEKNSKYKTVIYNVILGESATSKLFQNVREKEGLAYSARSNYVRQKNNIYIRCGIEIQNYEKALEIIKEQLEDMKKGNFTDEDIVNAKKYMISGIKTIQDEQDSVITYYIGQELSGSFASFEEYIEYINKVTKQEVEDIANKIQINIIYFLKN